MTPPRIRMRELAAKIALAFFRVSSVASNAGTSLPFDHCGRVCGLCSPPDARKHGVILQRNSHLHRVSIRPAGCWFNRKASLATCRERWEVSIVRTRRRQTAALVSGWRLAIQLRYACARAIGLSQPQGRGITGRQRVIRILFEPKVSVSAAAISNELTSIPRCQTGIQRETNLRVAWNNSAEHLIGELGNAKWKAGGLRCLESLEVGNTHWFSKRKRRDDDGRSSRTACVQPFVRKLCAPATRGNGNDPASGGAPRVIPRQHRSVAHFTGRATYLEKTFSKRRFRRRRQVKAVPTRDASARRPLQWFEHRP